METFGQVVRRLRRARRWSQEVLGAKASLDQSTVSQVELDRGEPTATTVKRLAVALGQSQAEFLRLAGIINDAGDGDGRRPLPPAEPDAPLDPLRIVAYVEQHPDESFRAELAGIKAEIAPEDYVAMCVDTWRLWLLGGKNSVRTVRRLLDRGDVTK